MNPNIAAQQIVAAKARMAAAANAPRLAYSTTTGDAPRPAVASVAIFAVEEEAHCFVCGRHTDHFGEHDEFVARGLATYDAASGSVYRTRLFADRPDLVEEARAEVHASVEAWLARLA